MAFLIDRRIAAESEEEFDAETDRYEELKNKLLGGQTMKYEEMEELLALAKSRNDQKVIGVLKNVVDDPVTDVGESMPVMDRPDNRTNMQSFVIAVDTVNATECKNDTTKYVTSGKNLTSGFSMHKDYYAAYKMKNLDDAAKFFVEVKEAYPTYSIWLLQDKYAIAPMKHKLERRDGLRAGWVAGDGWVWYSNKEFVKAVENAEKDRETEKQKVQSMRDAMMARHRQQPAATTGWTVTGIKKEKPKAKSMLDILNCLAESDQDDEDKDVIDKLLDKIGALVKKLKPGKLRDKLEDAIGMLTVDESNT